MHVDDLGTFNKFSNQIKLNSKLEKDICDIISALYSSKKEHTSLVSEEFNAFIL